MATAEELIAEKGLSATTISEISQRAGVTTSLVHKYFGTKENLLFSLAVARMEDATEELREQLRGIKDPVSRLRKMIWYSLRFNDNHPGFIITLLFEVRSNRTFYLSSEYETMKNHSRITMDILNQGAKDGVFRSDIDMRLVRDIIYGIFDFESISCFITREIQNHTDDFEEIIQILMRIALARKQNQVEEKKLLIMRAAEKEFAEHGFHKAKISKIASQAKLAEGTIYEYFRSKQELLFSTPIIPFENYLYQLQNTFDTKSHLETLRNLLYLFFINFLSNRNLLSIFIFDIQFNSQFYSSHSHKVFRQQLEIIEQAIECGKTEGAFRSDLTTHIFRNMFLGAFTHMAIRWINAKNDRKYDKMMEIENLINLMTLAIVKES